MFVGFMEIHCNKISNITCIIYPQNAKRTCKGDTAQQPVQLVPKSLGIHRDFPKSFSQECIRIHELPICFFEKKMFLLCFKKWLDVVNSSLVFFLRFVNRETVLMFCSQMNQAIHFLSTSLYSPPFNQALLHSEFHL